MAAYKDSTLGIGGPEAGVSLKNWAACSLSCSFQRVI